MQGRKPVKTPQPPPRKLAEGSHQGTRRSPLAPLVSETEQRLLEVRTAERDRALDLLEQVLRVVTEIGGYMDPADQDRVRAARALLADRRRA